MSQRPVIGANITERQQYGNITFQSADHIAKQARREETDIAIPRDRSKRVHRAARSEDDRPCG